MTESKIEKKAQKSKIKNILNKSIVFTMIALILIVVFSIALTPVTFQNDTYYTIKIGEHIAQEGIDMKDPFSWHEDLAYTYPHWLYDLLTYEIYQAFGMDGIYIVTCILSVILGITIYLTNTKLVKNQLISFVLTLGAMYFLRDYIAARAQLVTFILFVFTIYFIERFLETKKRRYALGLIVIPILIANLHVAVWPFYFVLYLPYIAEYFIALMGEIIIYRKWEVLWKKAKIKYFSKKMGQKEKVQQLTDELKELEEKIDRVKVKRTKDLKNPYKIKLVKNNAVPFLILIMLVCTLTGLLTPLGDTPYTYLVKTMQGNTTENINEHLPMTISNETEVMCVLVVFLAILIFTKAKIRLSDLFMIAGLCYLMLMSRRQVTMFALIGVFILNRLLMGVLSQHTEKGIYFVQKFATNIVVILLLTAGTLYLTYDFGKDKLDDSYVDESAYPTKACDYILENIDIGLARFYNEYNYGSYMLFRGIPVFIDSRADLYAPEFSGKEEDIFMDFIETSNISRFYEDVFEKYQITHVITYQNSKMNMIITKTKDANYKELYSDKYFVIYERESAKVGQEE